MTEPTPAIDKSVQAQAVLELYAKELATMTQRALIAEALADSLESQLINERNRNANQD